MSHSVQAKWRRLLSPIGLAIAIGLSVIGLLSLAAQAGGTVTICDEAHLNTALVGGGSITFNCGGPATIKLSSQKIIAQPTSINGGGIITLSGGGATRLFNVTVGSRLTLANLTIANGRVITQPGGGAIINDGTLIASNVLFWNNVATNTLFVAAGGAIRTTGALTITNSRFISNAAVSRGGAISFASDYAAPMFISGTTFYSNTTNSWGGAIDNDGADPLLIINSVFHDNRAHGSGAIDNDSEGPLIIRGSRFYNNTASDCCGAIYVYRAFTLTNSSLVGNRALSDDGGGLFVSGYTYIESSIIASNTTQKQGGGLYIYNNLEKVRVVISDTSFYSNTALTYGGALANSSADPLMIINSTFHDNVGNSSSGALENSVEDGALIIKRSRFYNNVALHNCCGAIDAYGVLTMTDTSIYNNVTYGANADGGGIWMLGTSVLSNVAVYNNHADRFGGGILVSGTPPKIYNSTIANNTAAQGGGIYVYAGAVTLTNVTLYGNTAITSGGNISGAVTAVNTIVASGDPDNCGKPLNSLGHNLESRDACGLNSTTDLTDTNPNLMPLASNGGPTLSMLPSLGSPAIDTGSNAACPPTDQRGFYRPANGTCDIGAVEAYAYSVYLPLGLKNF
jgi:hypothetical protein